MLKIGAAALAALGLAGCISTQELPLAPNVVRLDTASRGLLFTGQTVPQTMRKAATATLERGYTHFRLADADLRQGSVATGSFTSGSANYSGSYGAGSYSGYGSGFATTTRVRAPTASASVTVIMIRQGEPGWEQAFRAEDVLRQYQ